MPVADHLGRARGRDAVPAVGPEAVGALGVERQVACATNRQRSVPSAGRHRRRPAGFSHLDGRDAAAVGREACATELADDAGAVATADLALAGGAVARLACGAAGRGAARRGGAAHGALERHVGADARADRTPGGVRRRALAALDAGGARHAQAREGVARVLAATVAPAALAAVAGTLGAGVGRRLRRAEAVAVAHLVGQARAAAAAAAVVAAVLAAALGSAHGDVLLGRLAVVAAVDGAAGVGRAALAVVVGQRIAGTAGADDEQDQGRDGPKNRLHDGFLLPLHGVMPVRAKARRVSRPIALFTLTRL